jgi:hypothetical protein
VTREQASYVGESLSHLAQGFVLANSGWDLKDDAVLLRGVRDMASAINRILETLEPEAGK